MCTLPRDEQYAAMDDMGDIDKVVLPEHELAPHFDAEPKRSAQLGPAILFAVTSIAAYAGLIAMCQGVQP